MMGWSSGTLQSSTRRGLVSARRWQSPHMCAAIVLEGFAQGFVVARAVARGAHGVELRVQPVMPSSSRKRGQHLQDFGVAQRRFGARAGRADDLGADLPELAVAAVLRAFAAELRADVVELLQQAGFAELVLDVGADDSGGVFGAEGERLRLLGLGAGAVFPGVHLFGDDVGVFAYAAGEELRVFEDGRADFAEVVAGEDAGGRWPRRGSRVRFRAAEDRACRGLLSGCS